MPSPLRRHPAGDDSPARASFVELFFDLVFVLAVTQLSSVLIEDLTVAGAAETLFLLLSAWWAWIYTTWMTNWFDAETRPVRAILLVGMLASLCGAIAIPEAFEDRAGLFVVGYVGIQLVRNAFVVLATQRGDPLYAPLVRIFVWSAWVSMIWLAERGFRRASSGFVPMYARKPSDDRAEEKPTGDGVGAEPHRRVVVEAWLEHEQEPDRRDLRSVAGHGSKDDPKEPTGAHEHSVRAGDFAQGTFPERWRRRKVTAQRRVSAPTLRLRVGRTEDGAVQTRLDSSTASMFHSARCSQFAS